MTSDSLPSSPGSVRTGGRMLTSKPNFLGWIDYQIFRKKASLKINK